MIIKNVTDREFRRYGRIVDGIDFTELLEAMKNTPCPDDVAYVASVPELEATQTAKALGDEYFGEMPIDVGYCNGHNWTLNALEYHRNSELNIAATDTVLLLGDLRDISEDDTYPTSLVEAFFLPAGTAVELYATTLHYAPCSFGSKGFQVAIVLPKGTNSELIEKPEKPGQNKLLFARNKWLLAHEEAAIEGAHIGLTGENIKLSSIDT